jgi:hypothetical protein
MSRDWDDLVENMQSEIKDEYLERKGNTRDFSDFLSELVDSSVPVYNSDRLDLVNDNHDLAYADGNALDLMAEPVESIYDFLAITIYCALEEEANKYVQELEDSEVECSECSTIIEIDGSATVDCGEDGMCKDCYLESLEEEEEDD